MTVIGKLEEKEMDFVETANCLMLLHKIGESAVPAARSGRIFECKTCGKRFPSFQSLGGHRASHNKPRLSSIDGEDVFGSDKENQNQSFRVSSKKRKKHTCPICGLEFHMGQALGGHMRKHRFDADAKSIVRKSHGSESDAGHYNSMIPEKSQRSDDDDADDYSSSNWKRCKFDADDNDKNSHRKDHEEERDLKHSSVPVFKKSISKRVLSLDLNLTPSENHKIGKSYHL